MIDDEITISKPDGFSGSLEERIAFEKRPKMTSEGVEYRSAHGAIVIL